jgi:Grx4 family monothiol glutaredoxin
VRAQPDSGDGEARITAQFSRSKPVKKAGKLDNWAPSTPGVYAIFNENEELQYIGLSRKIASSVQRHAEMPHQFEKMHSVQALPMPGASKQGLQSVWTGWIESYVAETGEIPVGNKQGEGQWLLRDKAPAKEDIKLTPGKGEEDLSMSLEQLIDSLVKTKRVVAFIKGTRTAPECGFSHQVLHLLNQSKVEYETVNVLDVIHNPGLREAIKVYSEWPTIPQVYVDGEFIGGADIVIEMGEKGELVDALQPKA